MWEEVEVQIIPLNDPSELKVERYIHASWGTETQSRYGYQLKQYMQENFIRNANIFIIIKI